MEIPHSEDFSYKSKIKKYLLNEFPRFALN